MEKLLCVFQLTSVPWNCWPAALETLLVSMFISVAGAKLLTVSTLLYHVTIWFGMLHRSTCKKYYMSVYNTTFILYTLVYMSWVRQMSCLGVFERKILRSIYGPVCEGVTWRWRYNEELYHLHDETDLIMTIRITRLRWAGHIGWM